MGEMRRRDTRNQVCSLRPRVNTEGRGGGWAGRRGFAQWLVVGGRRPVVGGGTDGAVAPPQALARGP